MSLFSVVITQTSVVTIEAPDAAAAEAALDNPEALGELMEIISEPSNWETSCEVKEPVAGASAEFKVEGNKFTVFDEQPAAGKPTVRRKK